MEDQDAGYGINTGNFFDIKDNENQWDQPELIPELPFIEDLTENKLKISS